MHCVRTIVATQLAAILVEVEKARRPGGRNHLDDAHQLLKQLRTSVQAEADDPIRCLKQRFRACPQDVDRGELLYGSGFEPSVLSEALGVSMRRVYQLLRLARLPVDVKHEVRRSGLSERCLRPLLKEIQTCSDLARVSTLLLSKTGRHKRIE